MRATNWEYKKGNLGVATVTDAEDAKGNFIVNGYASLWRVRDGHGDITVPGAFKQTIKARPKPPLLWAHKSDLLPLGRVELLKEDSAGLFFSATIPPTTMGKDAALLVKSGALSGVSYGFNVISSFNTEVDREATRGLNQVDLWEISLVNFPSLTDARLASWSEKMAGMIRDAAIINRLEEKQARGHKLTDRELAGLVDAHRRQGERLLYDGQTALEWRLEMTKELATLGKELRLWQEIDRQLEQIERMRG